MSEYRLFGNLGYKALDGLRQICIVVDNRFGYVGITDDQWQKLNELEKKVYSIPIDELLEEYEQGNFSSEIRERNVATLKANRINDVWVQWDGEKVVGFILKPHSSGGRASD